MCINKLYFFILRSWWHCFYRFSVQVYCKQKKTYAVKRPLDFMACRPDFSINLYFTRFLWGKTVCSSHVIFLIWNIYMTDNVKIYLFTEQLLTNFFTLNWIALFNISRVQSATSINMFSKTLRLIFNLQVQLYDKKNFSDISFNVLAMRRRFYIFDYFLISINKYLNVIYSFEKIISLIFYYKSLM